MLKPKRVDAITELSPKTGFSSDNDGNVIEWDISSTKSGFSQPTEEAIQAKLTELQAEYDAKKYQRDRLYPPIGDQLDEIYHKGIDEWKKTIKKVKDAHPKPSE